jgi:hypothetical protein
MSKALTSDSSIARFRGLGSFSLPFLGSASLHLRFYAFTRSAGLGQFRSQ